MLIPLAPVVILAALFFVLPEIRASIHAGFAILIVVFVGLFYLTALVPAVLSWRDAGKTSYILTDGRAVISSGQGRIEIDLGNVGYVELIGGPRGTSTIYFGAPSPLESIGAGWFYGHHLIPAFRSIHDGERVYQLITAAKEELRRK